MLKVSLIFVGAAGVALFFADIEITTLHPWSELGRMAKGMVTPDLFFLVKIWKAFLNTVAFALCGTFIGVCMGAVLSFLFELTPVRLFCAFIRAIHQIFWAFIFLPVVGLNPACGVLAIAVPYAGIFAKVFAEIRRESDQRPLQGLPDGSSALSRFFYGSLPVIYRDVKHYIGYRFECALRSSAVLGFIGLPTLGFFIDSAIADHQLDKAMVLIFMTALLNMGIDTLSQMIRRRLKISGKIVTPE